MDYNEFASDLPLNGRVSFSSAEESEEVMQSNGVNQQLRQLSKGVFRADFASLETNQATLVADRFNQACLGYLEPPPDMVFLAVFSSAGGQFLVSGENVANDTLVVLPDGCGVDLAFPKLAGSEGFTLPKSRYIELMQVLCPSCAQSEGMNILEGDTRQLHSIRNALNRTMAGAGADDEEIANLVANMIVWAGYSSSDVRPEILYSKLSKSHIAKQVQAHIEEHFHESIFIEDLCRATGKEVRTLQRCFRQYFDVTITGYLKMVRLDAAHRALSSAHPEEETIASIALQNGFTHFGRFSVEYKNHFGVSARETLATSQSR
jgi:AraC-like DNA-binding protein